MRYRVLEENLVHIDQNQTESAPVRDVCLLSKAHPLSPWRVEIPMNQYRKGDRWKGKSMGSASNKFREVDRGTYHVLRYRSTSFSVQSQAEEYHATVKRAIEGRYR